MSMAFDPSATAELPSLSIASDSPAARIYRPAHLLGASVVQQVLTEFRDAVPRLFGGDLCFGFVFGGFAKGHAVRDQDADCFICVRAINPVALSTFHEWYFDLHARHRLTPDRTDPGEIMTSERLLEKLRFLREHRLRTRIETYYEYEAIVWADALAGPRAASVGDLNDLETKVMLCETLPQRWRAELLALVGASADLETAKLPLTRLFRRLVHYEKHGDNSRPSDTPHL
jgi:hypothetical protein